MAVVAAGCFGVSSFIAVDGCLTALTDHVGPFPGGVGDEHVTADDGTLGTREIGITVDIVEVEDRVGIGAEVVGHDRSEVGHGRGVLTGEKGDGELTVVVAQKTGHL